VCLIALAGDAGAEPFVASLAVSGSGRLRLDLDRGSVDVLAHREPTVHARAEARGLGASSVRVELLRDGADVVLRVRTDPWVEWLNAGPSVSVQIWIPASFEVFCASQHVLVTRRDAVELSYPTRVIGNLGR
jgi:hypothetical protein